MTKFQVGDRVSVLVAEQDECHPMLGTVIAVVEETPPILIEFDVGNERKYFHSATSHYRRPNGLESGRGYFVFERDIEHVVLSSPAQDACSEYEAIMAAQEAMAELTR